MLAGLVRTALSVRRTVSAGRVARCSLAKTVGGFQVGLSCHVKRAGQEGGQGAQGSLGDSVAQLLGSLGQDRKGEEMRAGCGGGGGREKVGSSSRMYGMGRGGNKIKPCFSSMPALGNII